MHHNNQIELVEAFSEPAIDRCETSAGVIRFALIALQPRQAPGHATLNVVGIQSWDRVKGTKFTRIMERIWVISHDPILSCATKGLCRLLQRVPG